MSEQSNAVCRCGGGTLRGTVNIPPSKSAAHRAMLCAALAEGRSVLSPIELSNDMRATINAVTALGAKADFADGTLTIDGIGGRFGNADREPVEVNCIESGSTLRFIIPIACAAGINGTFVGEGTLVSRPIGLYKELLPQAGVTCETEGGLPFVCRGKLRAGTYEMPGDISSQFITGMLIALPLCERDSRITLTTPLQSAAYVDMTVRCMADFGVQVERTADGWHIPGGQRYEARDYTVEGDWSHAGFFLAAGAMGSQLTLRGLRMDSVQGDKAAVELFRGFGAEIDVTYTEPTPVAVTGVDVSPSTASIEVGETTTLTATVSPSTASNKSVTWSTSASSVATVSDGVVTGVSAGTARITATTVDGGFTDYCEVTVTPVVTYEFVPASSMQVGKQYLISDGNSAPRR